MGLPKQLLAYKESTLIGHTLKQLTNLSSVQIFVVTGAFQEEVTKEIASFDIEIIHHAEWEMGMGSSLARGIREVKKNSTFGQVLITLCDLPLLDSTFYESLIEFHISQGNDITRTAYSDVKGVPAVFNRSYFLELEKLSSEEGAKNVVQSHKERVTDFTWPEPYFDIDTPEAYEKLQRLPSE
ncbi:MAG: hypothetical protein Aureis2KO_21430 [Aureisphaera sp.]